MAVPNKKIRLTFLWADESVFMEDYQKKSSAKMIDWANAFFGKYGFELDVSPAPATTSVQKSLEFCLSKSDGYEPDELSVEDIIEMETNEKRPFLGEWLRLFRQRNRLEDEAGLKSKEVVDALLQLNNLPVSDTAGRDLMQQKLLELMQSDLQLSNSYKAAVKELEDYEKNYMIPIEEKYKKRMEQVGYDLRVRLLVGKKILESFPVGKLVGMTSANDKPAIYDPNRLKVIFCRFKLSPFVLKMRQERPQPFGLAEYGITTISHKGQYLFSGAYILINVSRYEGITLAHEIVHAAGRPHITDLPDEVEKLISTLSKVTGVSKTILSKNLDPGYFDGTPNDIINYNSKGHKPDDVILTNDDKTLLEKATFVKDPP